MISVSIAINGEPIFARSAHRRTKRHDKDGKSAYLTDAGDLVYHDYDDGAIKLAIKLLKTIKEAR